jgi:hypothetical protein
MSVQRRNYFCPHCRHTTGATFNEKGEEVCNACGHLGPETESLLPLMLLITGVILMLDVWKFLGSR